MATQSDKAQAAGEAQVKTYDGRRAVSHLQGPVPCILANFGEASCIGCLSAFYQELSKTKGTMNRGIKTDDPDFNGNKLTGYWGGNGDPYLSIIEADTDDHIKGIHSVRVAFSGGNFPSELKVMIGMLVNMIQRFEPYIDEHGRFNPQKQMRDILHGEFKDMPCNSFIHEARSQMGTYMSAGGKSPDVFMLGCAVGIQWAAERIKDIITAVGTEEEFLKFTLLEKLEEMLRTE